MMNINYTERMWNYYPEVIKAILEFQVIIESEAPEIESLNNAVQRILDDAYLYTMSEDRIKQWEKVFAISVIADSSLEDRRDTIIARIRGNGKLNTEKIEDIVSVFTNGTAISWVENNTLYVEVTPPPGNKAYQFTNLERELKRKIPAHLGFKVARNYFTWGQVYELYGDVVDDHKENGWKQVVEKNNPNDDNTDNEGWRDILFFVPFSSGGVEIQ